ncbi:unnamed protein product [Brachionus calyciflorus]|uniref:MMAA n=1 Tax=Brachionus calyciflorus TaxID=104777 RepID=A0A813PQX0_9BILA|nr:unnamed protein product [Brachionus calyciflorus]
MFKLRRNVQTLYKNFNQLNLKSKNFYSDLTIDQQKYVNTLYEGVVNNRRAELAKAITLIETTNPIKKLLSQNLLNSVLHRLKNKKENNEKITLRIGFTGPPGAGKSSLIESFGKYLTTQIGAKLAVLTVDPSSTSTGGSILGDKVRMPELSRDPNAYIRSSPNKCNLGGVTRTTLETIFLCEAANFDVVLVETVGVGQAEHTIVNMVDCMVLLIPPGSGDELQGLKKGIVELADIVAITKYDQNLMQEAVRVRSEYLSASKFVRRKSKNWSPRVILTSSREKTGIDELWKLLCEYKQTMLDNNEFYQKRQDQVKLWFWTHLKDNLLETLLSKKYLKDKIAKLEAEVIAGNMTPGQANDILINEFNNQISK